MKLQEAIEKRAEWYQFVAVYEYLMSCLDSYIPSDTEVPETLLDEHDNPIGVHVVEDVWGELHVMQEKVRKLIKEIEGANVTKVRKKKGKKDDKEKE